MTEDGGLDLKGAMDEDFELYPFYTIDQVADERPIIQCMLRNTIREILLRAVSTPPTILDISGENLENVFGIKHPDEYNHKRREEARAVQQLELEQSQNAGSTEESVAAHQAIAEQPVRYGEAVVDNMDIQTEDSNEYDMYFGSTVVAEDGIEEDEA